jgi:DMSO/TMAO reductase YedYZ molybdopterin-dependent catalytic subunit
LEFNPFTGKHFINSSELRMEIEKKPSASVQPGLLTGLLVSAMVTASLISTFYLAWKVAGLPFVPFDVFDWMTRILPGQVLAFGIGAMVTVIRALNLGPTAAGAKAAEHAMAIAGMFFTGIFAGTILFGIIRALRGRYARTLGLALGIAVAVPVALISHQAGQTASTGPGLSGLWVLVAVLFWGATLGWAYQQLLIGGGTVAKHAGEDTVERIDRRRFLVRLGGATAVVIVIGAVVGELAEAKRKRVRVTTGKDLLWSSTHPLPNAKAAVKPVPGTRPEYTPLERHYRIDIDTSPPIIDPQHWRLKIDGLVEKPLALTLDELQRFEPMHQFITLSCISNPVGGDLIGTTRWTGACLQRLLPSLRLQAGATHLKIRAADGFYEVVSLETIRSDERVMLTYAWDGVPLLPEHGFPLRIYIPDIYGMKQPKWIESIEVTDHWEPGFWVDRGWDKDARMKSTSVIDTVAVDMTIINADHRRLVPIGGIAHAGARGISRVELQVDDGPWQEAALRTPLSDLTWVVWRYEWPFDHGKHTFRVRCYEGNGTLQIASPSPVEPSGATGLYSRTEMF